MRTSPDIEPSIIPQPGLSRREFGGLLVRLGTVGAVVPLGALAGCASEPPEIGPGVAQGLYTPVELEKLNYDTFLLAAQALTASVTTNLGEQEVADTLRWSEEGYVKYRNRAAQAADNGEDVKGRRQMAVEVYADGRLEVRYIDNATAQSIRIGLTIRTESPGWQAIRAALDGETPDRSQVLSAVIDPSLLELHSLEYYYGGIQYTIKPTVEDVDDLTNSAPIAINGETMITDNSTPQLLIERQKHETIVADRRNEVHSLIPIVDAA